MKFAEVNRDLLKDSFYAASVVGSKAMPMLEGDVDCDVAIVGGGIAGLSAALELAERGRDVRLLEADRLACGASGRNGGQAIHGLACDQLEIERQLGAQDAKQVWDMTIEALALLRKRIARHEIACDWQDGHLTVAAGQSKARALAEQADKLEGEYGYPVQRIGAARLQEWLHSPRYAAGFYDRFSGHLHPLKYTLGLARAASDAGAELHEASPVTRIDNGELVTLHTPRGRVRARQVLLAGNVQLQGLVPALERRIMPVGTYMVATQPLDAAQADGLIPCRAAVADTNFALDYFRLAADQRVPGQQRLLYGGGVSYSGRPPRDLAERMRRRMVRTFPQLDEVLVEHAWGGFVDITMNRAPDFGRLPSEHHAANIYYLQGFAGHGLALTGLAGSLVAHAMCGDSERFDVFARLKHRPFPGGPRWRTPALILGTAWFRLKEILL